METTIKRCDIQVLHNKTVEVLNDCVNIMPVVVALYN